MLSLIKFIATVSLSFFSFSLLAADFQINCCKVQNPPAWLTSHELNETASDVASKMHWIIRRITVVFYDSSASFAAKGKLGFAANAFFSASTQTMHVSPQKDFATFEKTFRHELVHVIFSQKFTKESKGKVNKAIPQWLEEGLANYIGSQRQVDYKWLKTQPLPKATELRHPSKDESGSRMHYQLSTATAEMIAAKCNLNDLLMLATGDNLESRLSTFCKIPNVNTAVVDWINSKS